MLVVATSKAAGSSAVAVGSLMRKLFLFAVLCQCHPPSCNTTIQLARAFTIAHSFVGGKGKFPNKSVTVRRRWSPGTHGHRHIHIHIHDIHSALKFKLRLNSSPLPMLSENQNENTYNPLNYQTIPDNILDAAAELTTTTSSLLGVKSIGVDYGLVRTGLAVTVGYDPKPLAILSDLNNTELSQRIIKLAQFEEASQIIVGLPFHKNGTEAEQTIVTREFANHLKCAAYAHFGPNAMPIYLWDERYTSKEAAARIRAVNPRANIYKELDADAACIILEYYYNDNGLGAQLAELPDNPDIRDVVHQAWLLKKEEEEKIYRQLTERRMADTKETKRAMMERARLFDEKLAKERGDSVDSTSSGKKKKKKKKRKKK